jgi:hypothetical protein
MEDSLSEEELDNTQSADTIEELTPLLSAVDLKKGSMIPLKPPLLRLWPMLTPLSTKLDHKKHNSVTQTSTSSSRINLQSLRTYLPDAVPSATSAIHAQEVSLPDATAQDPLHQNEDFNQVQSDTLSDSKPKGINDFVLNLWKAINVSEL